MSKVKYNLEAKLKALKKAAHTHFLAGHSVKVVSTQLKLSEHIVKEWHDEFVTELLQGSASKRIFLRELLLKNAPSMILTLTQLAKQKADEKLAYSASSAVLAFASRFMQEDARIVAAEAKAKAVTGNDPMLRRTLFDFRDPDVDGQKQNEVTHVAKSIFGDNYEEEIEAAIAALEGSGGKEESPSTHGQEEGDSRETSSTSKNNELSPEDYYRSQQPTSKELFNDEDWDR